MKILLTGADGQLGSAIAAAVLAQGWSLKAVNRQDVDITDRCSVLSNMEWSPQIVVNAAAYTAVDKAEDDSDAAFAVNELGVQNLVSLCTELNIPIISFSTDYVFSGKQSSPYLESDEPNPIGVYGLSKRAGERVLEASGVPYLNIRTSWVFGEEGHNFVKTMIRLAETHDELKVVSDQIGCPTYTGDLAELVTAIVKKYAAENSIPSGHYHYAGIEKASWYEFAEEIFTQAKAMGLIETAPKVFPVPTDEYPTRAERPTYSVMSCRKVKEVFAVPASDWKAGLSKVLKTLKEN
ncbi:dTDP-4-dehydrorhamnose reductase [Neptuniibacter caesariensis]|uniref:dTDP-4-dehydrorhamnose reductase n=1 Tax=Neptuniibacter caesariensis TaxID=207954 RepID=A0A7U8C3F2_NEPCE|nr:dTDP-4-dehydrorhamnose reductase [Neptuniibacter caesariensis]EAR60783.1 dTDP-4-dehydrorhamnose reductase [Oceanospirillum sp. MED92] [Neptuniibacter caesariensis]